MIEVITVINTIAIIALILLQFVIFRQGKPKMNHLTQWMKKQEAINNKLIESNNYLKIHSDLQKTVIETLRDKIQGGQK